MTQTANYKAAVLVVEDEPILSKVCARILSSNGYLVKVAENGLVAQSLLQTNHFDICLCDIRTPEMNGMELFKYTRVQFPALAEKTIFMTGDSMSKDIKSFLEDNKANILPKPFTGVELCAAVDEVAKTIQ